MKWTTRYIDSLPDSAFAYVAPGGHRDRTGRAVPRALRMLPYKNRRGGIDPDHVRNALARFDQTRIPQSARARVLGRLRAAARAVGIDAGKKKSAPAGARGDFLATDSKRRMGAHAAAHPAPMALAATMRALAPIFPAASGATLRKMAAAYHRSQG